MKNAQFKKREEFLKVYSEFDAWLIEIGFETATLEERMSPLNYHYSGYDKDIDPLYSVENYRHHVLQLDLRFMRDRNKHLVAFIGGFGLCSDAVSLKWAKSLISDKVLTLTNGKLNDLTIIRNKCLN